MRRQKGRELIPAALVLGILVLVATVAPRGAGAQEAPPGTAVRTLWTNPKTGEVFTKPGPGRVPISAPSPPSTERLQRQIEQLQSSNVQMKNELAEIRPAWRDYLDNFKDKIRIGALMYFDDAYFTHTGYGPQFLTQENWPGPGNNHYNSFDLTRAYVNFFFFPTKDWTLRITPNVYRAAGGSTPDNFGKGSQVGSNLDGNLDYRLKYAYIQYNSLFKDLVPVDALKDDGVIIGVQPQPLTAWEEDLYGFRWVNLTTWNMAVSSTFPGVAVAGPVRFGPEHLQYIDYNVGVFGNGNFHQQEQTDTKQVWGRVSIYPFGARWRFDGLGITNSYSYGYANSTPDSPSHSLERYAGIVHYTGENWQLAGEFDWGQNAFSSKGALFSAVGPAAVFSPASVTNPAQLAFGNLATALTDNVHSQQQGFNFFGHYHIMHTSLTLFGWFEQWMPNTKVDQNPFDFQRIVAGVAYQWNEYLNFALDTQNLTYYHNQFDFPVAEAQQFGFKAPMGFTDTAIRNAVMTDTHAIMLNAQFAF